MNAPSRRRDRTRLAPTVSLTSPAAGQVAGTVAVTATATDNVGVTSVQFLLDGHHSAPPTPPRRSADVGYDHGRQRHTHALRNRARRRRKPVDSRHG